MYSEGVLRTKYHEKLFIVYPYFNFQFLENKNTRLFGPGACIFSDNTNHSQPCKGATTRAATIRSALILFAMFIL